MKITGILWEILVADENSDLSGWISLIFADDFMKLKNFIGKKSRKNQFYYNCLRVCLDRVLAVL